MTMIRFQIYFTVKRATDLSLIKKKRGEPDSLSDDQFVKKLLNEKIDDELLKMEKHP